MLLHSQKSRRVFLNARHLFTQSGFRKLSVMYDSYNLAKIRLFLSNAVWHNRAGFSHFQSTVTKSDTFRQSNRTKKFDGFEEKPTSFFESSVNSRRNHDNASSLI